MARPCGSPRRVAGPAPGWGREGRSGSAIVLGMQPLSAVPSMPGPRRSGPGQHALAGSRRGDWLVAGLAAIAGHGWLLHALADVLAVDRATAGQGAAVARVELVAARQVPPVPRLRATRTGTSGELPPTPVGGDEPTLEAARRAPAQPPLTTPTATQPAARPQPVAAAADSDPPSRSARRAESSADDASAASAAARADLPDGDPPSSAGPTAVSLPSYPARLPRSFVMRLQVRRDGQAGSGEMRFDRDADGGYQLRLSLRMPQRPLLEMTSAGPSGETGLAPERFTDRRRGRGSGAANFDRAAAEVRFSSQAPPAPIAPLAQDRVSWLVQLAGVVQADERLRQPGAQVLLQVVGARGGAAVWRFEAAGPGESPSPAATVGGALRYVREPQAPYDQRVEVWLDPARQHLPVYVRLTFVPLGQQLEFWVAGDGGET